MLSHVPEGVDARDQLGYILVGGHGLGGFWGVMHLVVGQRIALDQVVALAPLEEHLGTEGVMVQSHLRHAGLGAEDEILIEMALTEPVEGDPVTLRSMEQQKGG